MRELQLDLAVLLVEHHMDLVMSVCDRLEVLDFGKVIASGTPDEIRGNALVTSAYLGDDVSEVKSQGVDAPGVGLTAGGAPA